MPAAIVITILAALCVAGVFAMLLVTRRPDEGWGPWLRSTLTAWRSRELSWVDTVDDDLDAEVGGLGALYQLSEPGNGYLLPPEELPEDWAAALEARRASLRRGTSRRQGSRRPSHAGS